MFCAQVKLALNVFVDHLLYMHDIYFRSGACQCMTRQLAKPALGERWAIEHQRSLLIFQQFIQAAFEQTS